MLNQEINHKKRWKYANPEIERRFLLPHRPRNLSLSDSKVIEDKYIEGTRLRLRKTLRNEKHEYKLTKKLPIETDKQVYQWVSTI